MQENELEINDEFPDELVRDILEKVVLWYAEFSNYILCGALPNDLNFSQNKKFLHEMEWYYRDESL